ncbi:MAG: PepSY-associated TM helix domain-containing protein [Alcanivorax sp.]|uniref:PepSY-associated TM helix domain-containing protein n=1 Tax=Alcanivorax sp. TaxID=1872427 RepID=UPI003DA70C8D
MSAKRTWFRVHSFTGVITGLLLFVICWSGTFAVLSYELEWLVTPELRVDPEGEHVSWSAIINAVEQAYPSSEVSLLETPPYERSATRALVSLTGQPSRWVYVDPYSARILGDASGFNIEQFFRTFHYSFFQGDFGFYLICSLAITLLISLIAAMVFYKRWWRRFFRLPHGQGRTFWSDLHRTAGLWAIWFVLIISVTGAWYLYEWAQYELGLGKISYAGTDAEYALHVVPSPESALQARSVSLDALVGRVSSVRPELAVGSIRFRDDGAVYVDGQARHLLVRDRANQIHLDRNTGEVLYTQTPQDYSLYWRWSDTADPLHFGDFGGLWSKVIWFLFGLVLCGLILTGTWLHARRLARASGPSRHRWPGTGAAIVVSLGVLVASIPFGIEEIRSSGTQVAGVQHFPDLAYGVVAVIIGWIALTLTIISGWVWLLWRAPSISTVRKPSRR